MGVELNLSGAIVTAAAALNEHGWTCDGGCHEPGHYDDCSNCGRVCDEAATAALTAAAPLIEAAVREQVAREIEDRADGQYPNVEGVGGRAHRALKFAARIARGDS